MAHNLHVFFKKIEKYCFVGKLFSHLADGVGAALREPDAWVRALPLHAGGADVAVVVEVAARLAPDQIRNAFFIPGNLEY